MSMREPDWGKAATAWRGALGDTYVHTQGPRLDALQSNVSGLQRRVRAVLQPSSTEEVREVVRIANACGTPLYPLSTGGNWGLGSGLPVRDDAAVVELKRMNRIHEVNVAGHYADIEPGVTQGQLYDYIHERGLPLILNVTGSGRGTSLIGNALERGVGYFDSRADALSGLEVVLGNGEVVRTGFGHRPDLKLTHLYRHGIGPELGGLFAQSNYGIVTRAGFDLIPRTGDHMSVIVKIRDEKRFVPFFDALIDLRRRGVMRTIWHVGNCHRSEIALAPLLVDLLMRDGAHDRQAAQREAVALIKREGFGPWNAVGGVTGSPRMLSEMRREIRAALKGIADVAFLNDRRIATAKRVLDLFSFLETARRKRLMLSAVEPLYGMSKGVPTDAALKSVLWAVGEHTGRDVDNPDESHSGMLYVLPFIPLSGAAAREVVDEADRRFEQDGFKAYTTLNLVSDRAAECVINLAFDRRDTGRTEAALRCVEDLTESCIRMGYPPYRLGIQSMDRMVDPENAFWRTVRALKEVLDPNHIIAPGRYNSV